MVLLKRIVKKPENVGRNTEIQAWDSLDQNFIDKSIKELFWRQQAKQLELQFGYDLVAQVDANRSRSSRDAKHEKNRDQTCVRRTQLHKLGQYVGKKGLNVLNDNREQGLYRKPD